MLRLSLAGAFALALCPLNQAQICSETVVSKSLDAGVPGPTLWTPKGAPVVGGNFALQLRGAPPLELGFIIYGPNESPVLDPATGGLLYLGLPLFFKWFLTGLTGDSPTKLNVPWMARFPL